MLNPRMAEKSKLGNLILWSYEEGLLECDTVKFGGYISPAKQPMQKNLQHYSFNILNREPSKSGVVF